MKYEEYREKVREYQESSKSQHRWCMEQGIPENTLRTWIKRVSRQENAHVPARKSYEEYRAIVIECKKSGKSAKEWCEERGILYATYGTWRKKVHRREGIKNVDTLCGIKRGRKPESRISETPVLCEIRR